VASDVIKQHDKLIAKLKRLQDQDRFTRTVLMDMHDEIDQRVFDEGLAANGQNFSAGTSYKKIGDYSKSYAKKRQKKGRQTNRVDLQFTNEFRKDFTFLVGKDYYGHGFKRARGGGNRIHNGDLSRYLEDKYEKPIFRLSAKERALLKEKLSEHVKIELK
jgi:hypothetical protein